MGRECSPPQPTRGYGASQAPPAGSGAEHQPQTILGHFMCNFTRFQASFTAFNSCPEMGNSYIPLMASRCDVPLWRFWGVGHPNLNFWPCSDTHDTRSGWNCVQNGHKPKRPHQIHSSEWWTCEQIAFSDNAGIIRSGTENTTKYRVGQKSKPTLCQWFWQSRTLQWDSPTSLISFCCKCLYTGSCFTHGSREHSWQINLAWNTHQAIWDAWPAAALFNLGTDSWLAWASGTGVWFPTRTSSKTFQSTQDHSHSTPTVLPYSTPVLDI